MQQERRVDAIELAVDAAHRRVERRQAARELTNRTIDALDRAVDAASDVDSSPTQLLHACE